MRNQGQKTPDPSVKPPQRAGAITALPAFLLLLFGSMLTRVGALCTGLGRRWLGDQTVRAWAGALDYFRGSAAGARPSNSAWEQRFGRIGASVVLSVFGALATLWTFLLIGGALAWIVEQGYGFYLLLGTVTLGVVLGILLARQAPRSVERDRLN